MNFQPRQNLAIADRRLPFDCVALLLQGGGALGAYQGGVYEALAEADLHPDWVAGISIGAINAAIIAGNPPAERVAKLRAFWEGITANPLLDWAIAADGLTPRGHIARGVFNQMSAAWALVGGATGFFALRQPAPWLHPSGSLGTSRDWGCKRSEPFRSKVGLRLRRADCSRHPQSLDAPSADCPTSP